jgi:hypothetical protein
MVGGVGHEHIGNVKWVNGTSSGESTRAQMVKIIEDGNKVFVSDGQNPVDVGVVKADPKYIRTYADGKWTDNLLALPRY